MECGVMINRKIEGHIILEEVQVQFSILPISPENEVVDCHCVHEARFVSKECNTECSRRLFLLTGYIEDYHISIMSEESEVNDGHDAIFDENIYDDSIVYVVIT